MAYQPCPAKSKLSLLVPLTGLGMLLGCSLINGSGVSATQNAPANIGQTQTAAAQAFVADLTAGQTAVAVANATAIAATETAVAIANATAIAVNETATAQAMLQTIPPALAIEISTPTANVASTPEFTPAPLPSATVSLVETPNPLQVEVPAGVERTDEDKPAYLQIDYRERMLPGTESIVNAFIYFLPPIASQSGFVLVEYPSYQPPILSPKKEKFDIMARSQMRLELSSPGNFFIIKPDPGPLLKSISPDARATLWTWTIVAPVTPNTYHLRFDMYRADGSWSDARYVIVQVEAPTPTPVISTTSTITVIPAPSPTIIPIPPSSDFWDRPGVVAFIGMLGTVLAALVTALIGLFVGRDALPIIGGKAGFRGTLQTLYSNLAQLENKAAQYGPLDVPLKLQNEIDATKHQIAEIEARLTKLKSQ